MTKTNYPAGTKLYTPAEIEVARDYIGHHADLLPRAPTPETKEEKLARRQARRDAAVANSNARSRAAGLK